VTFSGVFFIIFCGTNFILGIQVPFGCIFMGKPVAFSFILESFWRYNGVNLSTNGALKPTKSMLIIG
jgi:hypothetical protein